MSYTAPAGNALVLQFGSGYTAPAGNALLLQFGSAASFVASMAGTLEMSGGLTGSFSAPVVTATFDAVLTVLAGVSAGHGVAGPLDATLAVSADVAAKHGVVGTASAALGLGAAVVALHPRYVLEGEVRDNGVLVDRRVRAYRRSDGALVTQGDTSAGRFLLNAGWSIDEFFLVPIDLDGDATDWSPPCANRVLSVLVVD